MEKGIDMMKKIWVVILVFLVVGPGYSLHSFPCILFEKHMPSDSAGAVALGDRHAFDEYDIVENSGTTADSPGQREMLMVAGLDQDEFQAYLQWKGCSELPWGVRHLDKFFLWLLGGGYDDSINEEFVPD